jgi:IS30 family transposase
MAQHAAITAALSMPVFFCDPHHPWQPSLAARHQRNTNRLLRQYLHKTADLGSLTQGHLNSVAAKLNQRRASAA